MQWTLPYGAASAACWIAMFAQRHFLEFGTTREQMAWIALNARKNAAQNPRAIYRDPLTLDDYLAARMISTPFCLYDCDVPVDGATAFVVSHVDAARDLRKPPLRVEAVGAALHGRPSWDQFDDLTTMALRDAAQDALAAHRPHAAPTWTWPSATTASASSPWRGSRRSASAARARAGRSSTAARASRSTASSRSTRTAASSRRGASTATATCTRRACSSGAKAASARCRAIREVAVAAAGGGPLGGCLLITRN